MTNLQQRLSDNSPEVRRRAVGDIPELSTPEAIDSLIIALDDEDWRVRKEAVSAVTRISDQTELVKRLIDEMVEEEKIGLRNAAVEALVAIGETAHADLIARLPDFEADGRKIVLEILGASQDPRIVDILIERLADIDGNVRACAAEWLGEQAREKDKAANALLSCLESEDRLFALSALQSLNRLAVATPWATLETIAADRLFGAELIVAMGRSGAVAAIPYIIDRIPDDDAASQALQLLHETSAAAAQAVEAALCRVDDGTRQSLLRAAHQGEAGVQRAATLCLLWSKPAADMEIIAQLAKNEGCYQLLLDELKHWDARALERLEEMVPVAKGEAQASIIGLLARLLDVTAGQAKIDFFTTYLNAADVAVATAAATAVARFGDAGVINALFDRIGSADARLRRAAGNALIEVGRRYPDQVRAALARVDISGRQGIELCRVIAVVGSSELAPRLFPILSDPASDLRAAGVRALAAVAGPEAMDKIALAMTDEDLGVRMAAATALGKIGPEASETIVSAVRMATGPQKAALIRALGHVGHPEAPIILKNMCRESAEVALAALDAMRALNLDMSEILEEILHHPDSEVVKQALTVFGSGIPTRHLKDLLDHSDWDVRLAAVDSMAAGGSGSDACSALKGRLEKEPDDLVLRAIFHALDTLKEGGDK